MIDGVGCLGRWGMLLQELLHQSKFLQWQDHADWLTFGVSDELALERYLRTLRTLLLLHWGQVRSCLGSSVPSQVYPQRMQRNSILSFSAAILFSPGVLKHVQAGF